jgi:uncharacterized protein YdeI (YjbR/CyaY-like superfamily)
MPYKPARYEKPSRDQKPESGVKSFASQAAWRKWLAANHATSPGVWLSIAKEEALTDSPTIDEALDEALCYGWVDGPKKAYDEQSWLQKFQPRRANSPWSKIHRDRVSRLIGLGEMHDSGLLAIDAAKAAGLWSDDAIAPVQTGLPQDFQAALEANPAAKEFFDSLDEENNHALLNRLKSVKKEEARAKKIKSYIGMLESGEKIFPDAG